MTWEQESASSGQPAAGGPDEAPFLEKELYPSCGPLCVPRSWILRVRPETRNSHKPWSPIRGGTSSGETVVHCLDGRQPTRASGQYVLRVQPEATVARL